MKPLASRHASSSANMAGLSAGASVLRQRWARPRRGAAALGAVLLFAAIGGCWGTQEPPGWILLRSLAKLRGPVKTTPVAPGILGGPTQTAPDYAVPPGTAYNFRVFWTAWCTYAGFIPDTSDTLPCDEQPFLVRVTCDGAACETKPPLPGLRDGIKFNGAAEIVVRPAGQGDLRLVVELEHLATHAKARKEMLIPVRSPERLVIECIYNPAPGAGVDCVRDETGIRCTQDPAQIVPDMPCPAQGMLDRENGSPISVWIYGQAGEWFVRLGPPGLEVTFSGFQPGPFTWGMRPENKARVALYLARFNRNRLEYAPVHAAPKAARAAEKFQGMAETPDVFAVRARFGNLESQFQMELR